MQFHRIDAFSIVILLLTNYIKSTSVIRIITILFPDIPNPKANILFQIVAYV